MRYEFVEVLQGDVMLRGEMLLYPARVGGEKCGKQKFHKMDKMQALGNLLKGKVWNCERCQEMRGKSVKMGD